LREEGIRGSMAAIIYQKEVKRILSAMQKTYCFWQQKLYPVRSTLSFLLGGGNVWYSRECEWFYCTEAKEDIKILRKIKPRQPHDRHENVLEGGIRENG
jgi:hypothetical protein